MNEFAVDLSKKLVIAALSAITVRIVHRSMDAVGFHATQTQKPKEAKNG